MAETQSNPNPLKQNPSNVYTGLYHPSQGTYYHDFSEMEEYQAALEKYKNHPLYQNLVNLSGLRGSYSPGFGERVASLFGIDTSGYQNWYSDAYSAFQQNLANIVQQMEAATYNSAPEAVKRENEAGINSALNGGPATGFGTQDEEMPVTPPSAAASAQLGAEQGAAAVRGPIDVLTGGLSFFLTNGLSLAKGIEGLKMTGLQKSMTKLSLDKSVRDRVFEKVIDQLKTNFPDMEALDKALKSDPSAGDDSFLDTLMDSLSESAPDMGDRTLNKMARRYYDLFKGNNLKYRTEAYRQLKAYYQEKYGAASEAAKPGYKSDDADFNTMVGEIGEKFYKYFDDYVELDHTIRSAEATIASIDAARAQATGTKDHLEREAELKKAQEELALAQTKMQEGENALWHDLDEYFAGKNTWYAPILRSLLPLARGWMEQAGASLFDRLIPHRLASRGPRTTTQESYGSGGEFLGSTVTRHH